MLNKYFILLIFPLLLVFSCKKPPDYSDTPSIKFLNISKEQTFDPDILSFVDSVSVSIHFEDGDGNLGLSEKDILNSKKYVDDFVFNYFVEVQKKINNTWAKVDFSTIGSEPLNSRFTRLLPEGVGPIDGELHRAIIFTPITSPLFTKGDTLRFDIYILDRELNQSNTVTTDEIIYGTP